MNESVSALYRVPNIEDYEDVCLLSLSETCANLEAQVCALAETLSDKERLLINAYICARNDLEVETIKTALRWGKRHYK